MSNAGDQPSQRPARGDHPGHRDHDRTLSAALCGARALLLVSDRSQAGVLAEGVKFTAKASSTNSGLLGRSMIPCWDLSAGSSSAESIGVPEELHMDCIRAPSWMERARPRN